MINKYTITGPNGEAVCQLSEQLAIRQKISDEQLEALKLSHQLKYQIFGAAKTTKEPLKLKMLAAVFDALETEQQKLWNFTPDVNHHRFFDFPGCKCPKMDNADALGTPYKVYAGDCLIHRDEKAKSRFEPIRRSI